MPNHYPTKCKFCGEDGGYISDGVKRVFSCHTKYWFEDTSWQRHRFCRENHCRRCGQSLTYYDGWHCQCKPTKTGEYPESRWVFRNAS